MADNRVVIELPSLRGSEFNTTNSTGQARAREYITNLRDAMRAALPDSSYKISDIAEWNGATNYKGFGFVFRDTNIGYELFIALGAVQSTSSPTPSNWIGSASLGTYAKQQNSTGTVSNASSGGCGIMIFLNHDYSTNTFAMGFNNTTDLTYTSGDYQTPASNPYSALSTFLPASWSSRVPGVWLGDLESPSVYSQGQLIYDKSIGVLRYDRTQQNDSGSRALVLIGRIFPAYSSGLASATDTLRHGVFFTWLIDSTSTYGAASTNARVWFTRENGVVYTNGVLQNMLSDFTRANYIGGGGGVRPRKLQVGNGLVIKGYLDPSIVAEAFPFNDPGFRHKRLHYPDADNPLLKEHANLCFMYKKDYPPFPNPDSGLPEV